MRMQAPQGKMGDEGGGWRQKGLGEDQDLEIRPTGLKKGEHDIKFCTGTGNL